MANRDRVYQVSANRESASHKLRYIERSAPEQGDCRLCASIPSAKSPVASRDDSECLQREDL
ncbi:MAG: acetyltransferase [Idiomarina sp. T82-3]|jgi:hypothetical protein|nr:MAG: acetyltransferase [Idiomarina sp. T82-3]